MKKIKSQRNRKGILITDLNAGQRLEGALVADGAKEGVQSVRNAVWSLQRREDHGVRRRLTYTDVSKDILSEIYTKEYIRFGSGLQILLGRYIF